MIIQRAARVLLAPVGRRCLGSVTHVATSEAAAALTFDDGPHPEYTAAVLDTLERHGARGTFFVIGQYAIQHPEILRRIVDGGHVLANHSWNHPSLPLLSSRERRNQITADQAVIAPYGGERLFRPPYGDQTLLSRLDAWRLGHRVVLFNCEVGDWYDTDPKRMARQMARQVRPGSIVCLHDALRVHESSALVPKLARPPNPDRSAMLEALELLLEERGTELRFVTVPALFKAGRPHFENWYKFVPPAPA